MFETGTRSSAPHERPRVGPRQRPPRRGRHGRPRAPAALRSPPRRRLTVVGDGPRRRAATASGQRPTHGPVVGSAAAARAATFEVHPDRGCHGPPAPGGPLQSQLGGLRDRPPRASMRRPANESGHVDLVNAVISDRGHRSKRPVAALDPRGFSEPSTRRQTTPRVNRTATSPQPIAPEVDAIGVTGTRRSHSSDELPRSRDGPSRGPSAEQAGAAWTPPCSTDACGDG